MRADLLHVVTCFFNPVRWKSREKLYRDFEQHMLDSGVHLTTVECELGDRPFILDNPHVNHVQVRSHTVLWNKENLLNLGVASVAKEFPDFSYVAFVDADVMFRNAGWATETVHALQQYNVIQPWSKCLDLGPNGEVMHLWHSFCRQIKQDHPMSATDGHGYQYAHTGFAWAWRREALEWVSGLLDTAALGAGDHHMAWSLIGHADWTIPEGVTQGYRQPVKRWESEAKHINQNLGYLHDSDIEHSWHGSKDGRKYKKRWSIIIDNQFDPQTDLKRNVWGVLELAGNKPRLRHELDRYFRERHEDSNFGGVI